MRTIGVVTTSRADYGHYHPLLTALQAAPDLELWLYVTGMHLAPEFGQTVRVIAQDGFPIRERVEMLLASDTPEGVAKSMGLGVLGFAQAYARSRPDLLVLLGDRFEMLAAGVAALPFQIPLVHLHGGELTEGQIDEAIRHSLTKMSHLHCTATETYRQRVVQLGEQPDRVFATGAPGLDHLRDFTPLTLAEMETRCGLTLHEGFLLVTFHPVTLAAGETARQCTELLKALEAETERDILFTYPNADPENHVITEQMHAFVARQPRAHITKNLGTHGYLSAMAHAGAMLGNSSSGIIEAASFRLPVVNIGDRQRGRVAAENVVQVRATRAEIRAGLARALSLDLQGLQNPYGDGHASARIVQILRAAPLGPELLMKRFYDVTAPAAESSRTF